MPVRRPAAVLLATVMLAGGAAGAAPSAVAAPATVSGLTLSATAVNTTDADRFVTVRLRVQDAEGVRDVLLESENVDRATYPTSGGAVPADSVTRYMTRVSGTDRDGVYELRTKIFRSMKGRIDYSVDILENDTGSTVVTADALRAAGLSPRVTATSTLAVPRVSNLKGSSVRRYGSVAGIPTTWRNGVITYTLTGFANGLQVTSQSGCSTGGLYDYYEADGEFEFGGRGYGICRLTLRPYNGTGYGATVSLTFL